jgi:hypothetical protein
MEARMQITVFNNCTYSICHQREVLVYGRNFAVGRATGSRRPIERLTCLWADLAATNTAWQIVSCKNSEVAYLIGGLIKVTHCQQSLHMEWELLQQCNDIVWIVRGLGELKLRGCSSMRSASPAVHEVQAPIFKGTALVQVKGAIKGPLVCSTDVAKEHLRTRPHGLSPSTPPSPLPSCTGCFLTP